MAASPRTSNVRHVPIPIVGTNKPDLPSGRISKVRFLQAMKNINGNEALPIKDNKESQYHTCEESRQNIPHWLWHSRYLAWTAGMVVYPQIDRIGPIGIFYCGF